MPRVLVSPPLGEENTIAFAPDRGENGCRGILWSGDEFEVLRACRPSKGRGVHNEMSIELLLLIVKMDSLLDAAPMHVEGNIRGYGRAILQRIHKVVVVLDLYIAEFHRCRRIIEVDLYTFMWSAYRPKQPTGSNTRIEVVDLIGRGNLSLIQIQSYEDESACVPFPIDPNVHTLHETHICVEEEGGSGAGICVCSYTRPVDNSGSNGAMKIEDGRIFGKSG